MVECLYVLIFFLSLPYLLKLCDVWTCQCQVDLVGLCAFGRCAITTTPTNNSSSYAASGPGQTLRLNQSLG